MGLAPASKLQQAHECRSWFRLVLLSASATGVKECRECPNDEMSCWLLVF